MNLDLTEFLNYFGTNLEEVSQIRNEYRAAFGEDPKCLYLKQPKNMEILGMKVIIQDCNYEYFQENQRTYISGEEPRQEYPDNYCD